VQFLVISGVILALLVIGLIAFIMFIRAYRVAAPNEALVITGRAPAKKGDIDLEAGARIVVGGRAIVRPLFDRAHVLSLSSRQIQVEVEGYSLNGIFLRLKGVAQIKVGEQMGDIRKAAQRFLDQQDSIESYCQEILSGTLRAVVGTLSVEQVLRDRASFASQVQDDAAGSMNNQGLVIDTFQIISVEDDSDYLRDLGRPEAALVAKKARIAESESMRESTEAENRDRQQVAESQKALDLRNAEIQRETAVQRAAAEAAEELAKREQEQRILAEAQKIADQKNELRERELIAEVRKPADAQQYEAERRADAERYKREQAAQASLTESENKARAFEIDAQAQARAVAERGRAEADAVKASGTAEASAIAEKGKAEAEAVLASAEAYKQFNQAAVLSQILEALPKIAHEVSAPYSNIESLSVVSSDGEAKLSKNIATGMRETIDLLKSTTGLDLGEFLQSAMDQHERTSDSPQERPESDTGSLDG
jgi:flotillin